VKALELLQIVANLVSVGDSQNEPNGVRVKVLGIPFYDSGWAGVKRRQARRQARRDGKK
jgi:hypothetical protein